jgi:DNA polymerase-3 subunit beta
VKAEILQENLSKGLNGVLKFVDNKASLPVLSAILIEANKSGLLLSATNMETGVEVKLPARVEEEGKVAVPARGLVEYVNLLTQGKVELKSNDTGLMVKNSKQKARFIGINADDFPQIPTLEKDVTWEINYKEMERIIRLVSFASAKDESRPVLSALCFDFEEGNHLTVIATDGYRMSLLRKIPITGEVKKMRLLVPSTVVREVWKMADEGKNEQVKIMCSDKQKSVVFVFGDIKVVSRLIDGDFPDFKRIIPESVTLKTSFDRDEMLGVVRSASVFARDSANIIRWQIEGNRIKVAANSSSVGEQEGECEAKITEGDNGQIAFNSKFLLELLQSGVGEVGFGMTEPLRPGLFNTKDQEFTHVIMPVRVQETDNQ